MIHAHLPPRRRYFALTFFALLLSLGAALLYNAQTSRALTVLTPANATISADTAADVPGNGAYTALGDIVFRTQINLWSGGYVRLYAPTGWEFDPITAASIADASGTECQFTGGLQNATTVYRFIAPSSSCLSGNDIRISGVRVRPINGETTLSRNLIVENDDGDGGHEGPTNVGLLTITGGDLASFSFAMIENHNDGETFSVTITALDQFGNTAVGFGGSAELYAEESTPPYDPVPMSAGEGIVGPFIAGELTTLVRFDDVQDTIILFVYSDEPWGESNEFNIIDFEFETETGLTALPAITVYGETVTMTATVIPFYALTFVPGYSEQAIGVVPDGTVRFFSDDTLLGSAELDEFGVATFTISSLALGEHSLEAAYLGTDDFDPSGSEIVPHTVIQGTTTTTISAPASVAPGATFTVSATVSPLAPASGTATGLVSFYDGDTFLMTAPLVGGVASVDLSFLTPGTHLIRAEYAGDTNFGPSTSALHTIVVDPAASQVSLSASGTPTVGQTITLTANVLPAGATGTVTFMSGSIVLGVAPLTNGQSGIEVSNLAAGTHTLTATYSGDANYAPSTSNVVSLTINPMPASEPPVLPQPPAAPSASPTAVPTSVPPASPTAVPTAPAPPTAPAANMTSGPSAVGDMTIGTGTLTGFAIGDMITINPGGANEESLVITGLNPLTFGTALLNAHLAGERIMLQAAPAAAAPTPLPPATGTGPVGQGNLGTLFLIAGLVTLCVAVGGPLALRKKR